MEIKVFDEPDSNYIDRYTVIIDEDVFTMSENPNSPQGFNQYWGNTKEFYNKYFESKKELTRIPIEIVKAIVDIVLENFYSR